MNLLRLDDRNKLSLAPYHDQNLPPYAILSHTWGSPTDEVTYEDVKQGNGDTKRGFAKILFCGERARQDDLQHFWVDSCCIDKSSSADLSEALNSMFRWYREAAVCYVYLQDVLANERRHDGKPISWEIAFRSSKWFTRGWTLQELIAPKAVQFWSRDGHLLGTKASLRDIIYQITGIPVQAILGAPPSNFSANERFRWASGRETTRKEDRAYCLLGLFGVFLPPIYGEEDHAFVRLRELVDKRLSRDAPAVPDEGDKLIRKRRTDLLTSLDFEQIDARHATIEDAQRTTCEWLLENGSYRAWSDTSDSMKRGGILWIAGKPGTGKSTLMKFALGRVMLSKLDNEIVISFFFNARGEELEKTTLGMYRSLLLQLLQKVPDLQHVLDSVLVSNQEKTRSHTWTIEQLQRNLTAALGGLGGRQVKIFIDALDECDIEQVRSMVQFLEDLLEYDLDDNSCLRVCFASRHYPTVQINYGWRLVLEEEAGHASDVERYLQRRLSKATDKLRADVQQKSSGVFLWVVLVVKILNDEISRGRMFNVEKRLNELPSGLSDLFKDILRRDNTDMDELLLCLQWILFSYRPLLVKEFYFAMQAGLNVDSDPEITWTPPPWHPEQVTVADMERLVLSASKGLAEVTKSSSAPTVQFIHESVPDFLIKDGGLCELWADLDDDDWILCFGHDRLKKCCRAYLTADVSTCLDLKRPPPKDCSDEYFEWYEGRLRLVDIYPFLGYAVQHVLPHADEAALCVSQDVFLEGFPFDTWFQLFNTYNKHLATASNTFLAILAEHALPRLCGSLLRRGAHVNEPGGRYGNALQAASYAGDAHIVEQLLEAGANVNAEGGYYSNALQAASYRGDSEVVKHLIEAGADVNARGGYFGYALRAAVVAGRTNVVKQLHEAGADVNAHRGWYGSAIQAALYGGSDEFANLLHASGAQEEPARSETALN